MSSEHAQGQAACAAPSKLSFGHPDLDEATGGGIPPGRFFALVMPADALRLQVVMATKEGPGLAAPLRLVRPARAAQSGPAACAPPSSAAIAPSGHDGASGRLFEEVRLTRYRGLVGVTLEAPGRINLIAGANNSGKTSILEALFLLSRQCDARALVEIGARRAHRASLSADHNRAALLPSAAVLGGRFGGQTVALDVWTTETQVDMRSSFAAAVQRSVTALPGGAPRFTRGERRWLCPAALIDPPFVDQQSLGGGAIRSDAAPQLLRLLRAVLGVSVTAIESTPGSGRVMVREQGGQVRDLLTYGHGMQRIVHIACACASVPGGLLLIDQAETSIHASIHAPLALLLWELARVFCVQVFLTTHSAEVIAAWTGAALREDVVGYGLRRGAGGQPGEVLRFSGERLGAMQEAFGFDLRGLGCREDRLA